MEDQILLIKDVLTDLSDDEIVKEKYYSLTRRNPNLSFFSFELLLKKVSENFIMIKFCVD